MKKAYVSPELELVRFAAEDVISTSFETFEEWYSHCQQVELTPGVVLDDGTECPEVYTCMVFG